MQQARNLAMDLGDRPGTLRFLVHDRDSVFTIAFVKVFTAAGLQIVTSLPRTPRMNAVASASSGPSAAGPGPGLDPR